GEFDAFVVGSSVYIDHWRKETRAFVERHREVLAAGPTWLFSSGPLGTEQTDEEGRDLREVTEPKEIAEVEEMIHPRGHVVFFGALDPKKLAPHHRLLRLLPAGRKLLPEGDFREWDAIEAWADGIAEELAAVAEGAE